VCRHLLFTSLLLLLGPVVAASGDGGPPSFIANAGQVAAPVSFYALGTHGAVYLTEEGPVIELLAFRETSGRSEDPVRRRREIRRPVSTLRFAVGLRFVDPTGPTAIEPLGESIGRRRFLGRGADPDPTPQFRQVAYREVWPGIDVLYRAEDGGLTYEFLLRPGADPRRARFAYEGPDEALVKDGAVRLVTPLGTLEDVPPTASTSGRLRWRPETPPPPENAESTELVAASLSWSTFVGGERDDAVYAVAVDGQRRPVVTGATRSADFPTTVGVLDPDYDASFDVFVMLLEEDGTQALWSTFIGGSGDDRGWAIALDSNDDPVIAGVTDGAGFPTTAGAYDETPNGAYDAFVLKLASDGSALIWSTLYGGTGREWDVAGLSLESTGKPVLAGSTQSSDLPTSAGAVDTALGGTMDAFVARFAADGSALEYGTYLGGAAIDAAEGIVAADAGTAVVVGRTTSDDFPVSAGALQTARAAGSQDGFVTHLAADGGSVISSTYLGGSGTDDPYAVELAPGAEILVTGTTSSLDFPTTGGAAAPGPLGGGDVFVTRLEPALDTLAWSTYFGGTGTDRAFDLVRDGSRGISFTGWTCSDDLPVTPGAAQAAASGPCEAFLGILSEDGSALDYASYLGGWRDDSGFGLAVDPGHRQILVGETWSTNFPVTPGVLSASHNSPDSWEDGFVAVLAVETICTLVEFGPTGPELSLVPAVAGVCPPRPPSTTGVDLIEGRMEAVSGADLGPVQRIECGTLEASLGTPSIPEPGNVLFQVAREQPGGSYVDGAGAGLVGTRVPASGDCPP
jgi:hypothetical protein